MIGATIVLYRWRNASSAGPAALIAAILWSLSEPAFRLAYATYDPLSVFLTTISAWLIVQSDRPQDAPLVFALGRRASARAGQRDGLLRASLSTRWS